MASQTPVPRHEMLSLIREVQSNQLFNRQLSSICQVNGLKSTGVKADLQRRIINREPRHQAARQKLVPVLYD